MAAVALPSQLTDLCWLKAGYGYASNDVRRRMATPVGAAEIRIGTTGPDTFNVTAILRRGRLGDFAAWFRYTLKNGLLWWSGRVNAGGIMGYHDLRFVGSYTVDDSFSLTHVKVSATVETRTGTEIDYTTYLDALAVGGVEEFIEINDLLELAMNVLIPQAMEP